MVRFSRGTSLACLLLATAFGLALSAPAQVNPTLYAGVQWRNIGPWHGGRISAVTGAMGQPGVYYVGTPQGGIWKTTSAGVTWHPIFDQVTDVDSIGAIQAAPSDPNVIYAGSGDSVGGSDGNGMYKSTDAGKTWQHIGLADTVKINKIMIDPQDPNLVLVSTQGDATRTGGGVYRTTDGGQTWQNVLDPDAVDGTRDLEYPYDMPDVMFAATQGTGGFRRGGPAAPSTPARLFKSTDEGKTWTEITTLPHYTGRISVAVAMHTSGQRIYVVGGSLNRGSGLVRSDDGGQTWRQMDPKETRIANGQGNYSSGVWVDSQDPNIVYTEATALYRSSDGGNTFMVFKGAPGGEDYHRLWIDPTNGHRMIVGADQGAAVSLDNGRTWSTWYNQPISQVYHVATTNQYPYWVLAAQQDTGAVMERSRGDFGEISTFDWLPLPSSEFGTITADPTDPNIMYGVGYGAGGGGSGMIKIDMTTGQWENVAPNFGVDAADYRAGRDFWKRFDTAFDPHALYVGYQCIVVSHDGAHSWKSFSPDLTTPKGQPTKPCGQPLVRTAQPAGGFSGRGAGAASITDFSISTVHKGVVWSVSSNGQIYHTTDGGQHWTNATNIPNAPPNLIFETIDAGHFDVNTAYVAGRYGVIPGHGAASGEAEAGTDVPLMWKTHDGGKTWTKITNGMPGNERTGSWVNVLRSDPKQQGLLFAGTETTVYVSFDDGANWQSLRQNLPTTSIRDLVFHNYDDMNDLVIGTYGRGFWIMDDMSPLRQVASSGSAIASAPAYLFKPGDAIRSRKNVNWDQPTEPEESHGVNPPFGAIIYYYLSQPPSGAITLQVYDSAGHLVRTLSSVPPPPVEGAAYPDYWLATPASLALPTAVGTNRTHWDLRYDDPPSFNHDLENQMNMVEHSVTAGPHGPLALPGTYTLKLTVDGHTYSQPLVVNNDPRVGEGPEVMADLRAQNKLTQLAYNAMKDSYAGHEEVAAVQSQVAALMQTSLPADVATQAKAVDTRLTAIGGAAPTGGRGGFGGFGRGGRGAPNALRSFVAINGNFNTIVSMMQVGLDTVSPTKAQIDNWEDDCREYNRTVTAWKAMQSRDLTAFNTVLAKNNLQQLTLTPTRLADPSCTFSAK
ncbi:MAG: WD40/YVTN/BNR-like repeat-containing protein [Terriglobales bacterium]